MCEACHTIEDPSEVTPSIMHCGVQSQQSENQNEALPEPSFTASEEKVAESQTPETYGVVQVTRDFEHLILL